MSVLRIRVCDYVYEIDVVKDILQKRFGTFWKENTPFKMNRDNWCNIEFFKNESRDVFKILIDRKSISVKKKIAVSDETKKSIYEHFVKEHPFYSQENCEELTMKEIRKLENESADTRKLKSKSYLTVRARFDGKEWQFVTEYEKDDIRVSLKNENYVSVLTSYLYTSEELGVTDVDENVFSELF